MDRQKSLSQLLHKLAECIQRSSDTDIDALLKGQAALTISSESSHGGGPGQQKQHVASMKRSQMTKKELNTIVDQLRSLGSRSEGINLLKTAQLTKKDLEQLARVMDLPVLREDDAERLRQKIVEASIGSRLNSQAIRGA